MTDSFSNWAAIANALEPACEEAVTTVAKAAKGHVQEHIKVNGQVRTGFMLNSVYASTPQGSDYSGGEKALPEEKPSSNTEAIVGVAAEYAVFPNYGTVYQSPKPFFEPGLDQTRQDFDTVIATLVKRLEEAGK